MVPQEVVTGKCAYSVAARIADEKDLIQRVSLTAAGQLDGGGDGIGLCHVSYLSWVAKGGASWVRRVGGGCGRVKAKHPLLLRLPDNGGIGVLCPEGQRPGSIPAWALP